MNPVPLIERKRDGGALSLEEYRGLVGGYLAGDGSVMEGQIAAFLMAGVLQGFTVDEARSLTTVLLESGDRLDLSELRGPTIDTHATGGVGDGTTLVVSALFFDGEILAGWAASLGEPVGVRQVLTFAGFVAALGLSVGALGASFEEQTYFRHVAYVDEET